MDAAAKVFAIHGSNASLNDVARAAGVGVATVYRKFADKDAMLDAIFEQKITSLVDEADKALLVADAGDAIRQLLFGVMEKRATDRGLDAVLTSSERNARFAHELTQRFLPTVDLLVARAVKEGELRADFSGHEVCLLAFMVGKVADITRESHPDVWRRYAQLLVDGTRSSPDTRPLTPAPLSFEESAAALGRAG
jgi:AcrR family transcriptional regulator